MGAKSELTGNSEFGDILRMSRLAVNATLEELGAASGVSFTRISSLERGVGKNPRTETIYNIANGLHKLSMKTPREQPKVTEYQPKFIAVPEQLIFSLQSQMRDMQTTLNAIIDPMLSPTGEAVFPAVDKDTSTE